MQRFRNAYTMIELIFVIVILGILATVVIPKLSATREDAKASRKAQMVMTAATEIVAYAVAVGQTESDLSQMSNTISYLVTSNEATLEDNKTIISAGTISDCVTIEITKDVTDDNLIITFGNASDDVTCVTLQSLINVEEYPIKLRGLSIVY